MEAGLAIPLILLGVSHIVRPQMWVDFFAELAVRGNPGVLWRTFSLELWPAVLIVSFHQVWTWPGVIITVYGHLLMVKVAISVIFPTVGLMSLRQAEARGRQAFIPAGLALIAIGGLCAWRVFDAGLT